jgi:hypothetical protein
VSPSDVDFDFFGALIVSVWLNRRRRQRRRRLRANWAARSKLDGREFPMRKIPNSLIISRLQSPKGKFNVWDSLKCPFQLRRSAAAAHLVLKQIKLMGLEDIYFQTLRKIILILDGVCLFCNYHFLQFVLAAFFPYCSSQYVLDRPLHGRLCLFFLILGPSHPRTPGSTGAKFPSKHDSQVLFVFSGNPAAHAMLQPVGLRM